jgi:hypothetical protein
MENCLLKQWPKNVNKINVNTTETSCYIFVRGWSKPVPNCRNIRSKSISCVKMFEAIQSAWKLWKWTMKWWTKSLLTHGVVIVYEQSLRKSCLARHYSLCSLFPSNFVESSCHRGHQFILVHHFIVHFHNFHADWIASNILTQLIDLLLIFLQFGTGLLHPRTKRE